MICMERDAITVELECGHLTTSTFREITEKAELPCWACKNKLTRWVHFRGVDVGWNLRCQRCRYARSFGVAQFQTYQKARQHAQRKKHKVNVRVDDAVVFVQQFIAEDNFDDVPPF